MTMQPQATPSAERMPVFCPRSLLMLLWDRAHSHLTAQELEWVASRVSMFTHMHAARLESVLEGVGLLVACDKEAGSFCEGTELADLLFLQADCMSMVGGMTHAAELAADMLRCLGSQPSHRGD